MDPCLRGGDTERLDLHLWDALGHVQPSQEGGAFDGGVFLVDVEGRAEPFLLGADQGRTDGAAEMYSRDVLLNSAPN